MRSILFFTLYTWGTWMCRPLIGVYLRRRVAHGKEDPVRYTEKMAIPSASPPKNAQVIWVHAISVGESVSALPLIYALVEKGYFVLVTTGTQTAAKIMGERLPQGELHQTGGALHQYAPLDCRVWIRAFLHYWNPCAVMFLESELWYNTLCEVHKRHIPLYLVNARLSQKTIRKCKKYPHIARTILKYFTKIYPQNRLTLQIMGDILGKNCSKIEYLGNLKYAFLSPPICPQASAQIQSQIANRPVWLVASTHPEDEHIVGDALPDIQKHCADILTIVVPRHPERLSEVQHIFANFTQAVRSNNDTITDTTQIYIADTMGELPLFYQLSPICLVGGSFGGGYGGHNPLEPARYDTAIVQGYDTSNFSDITDALQAVQGHIQVSDSHHLAQVICDICTHPQRRQTMAQNAKKWVHTHENIVQKLLYSMGV